MPTPLEFNCWGGTRTDVRDVLRPASAAQARLNPHQFIAYGNGRSYDDTCLPADGGVVDARSMNAIVSFNAGTGVLRAEAGALLSDVITHAAPHGWFVPVTPGTRWVTLGGALANDVHGKNHHLRGSFGHHVLAFELLRSDGSRRICSPHDHAELFHATIGGMGLTGLVTTIDLQLMPVSSLWLKQNTIGFDTLQDYMRLDRQSDAAYEYTVAWIDAMAKGKQLGRGVFMRANHALTNAPVSPDRPPSLSVPFRPPISAIPGFIMPAFNALYRRRAADKPDHVVDYRPFFYPLDGLAHWNRLYGRAGLRQFQCVVPAENAHASLERMLLLTHERTHPSYLAVLKRFGDRKSLGMMSFARPGYTLAMDFPNRGDATQSLFEELQQITINAGGAVNPYKDAQMSMDVMRASFPQWREFSRHIDPAAQSRFSVRVGLDSHVVEPLQAAGASPA